MTSDGGGGGDSSATAAMLMTSSLLLPPVTSLTVRDEDRLSLRCVSRGGCPAPPLRVLIGQTDVTSSFRRTNHDVEVSGRRGLRRMTCGATLRTAGLVARRQFDQLPVRCEAATSVEGAVPANTTRPASRLALGLSALASNPDPDPDHDHDLDHDLDPPCRPTRHDQRHAQRYGYQR